ncbi:hypothetical protein FOXG_21284 [Fusarium oxysporum f. sp. lycopersici 4287]|uniref:Uncharacterized protein n=2 Tax=Fusarium oxysporum TaxID=5507 RepID=A0A0J9WT16_FUSO4|nr:hypothetical protein FOXG_21284 [Fusarium oxysporum f. sp. lycopersici 4287]EXK34994.1 hypothetical protein FOMG_10291 [Fusarium oxysporum f. sp. melonis 26406]KNB15247.1 hypothetical protein FOXG_21284 [Fusarium oxysporum f. sp. lycopersici 4287]
MFSFDAVSKKVQRFTHCKVYGPEASKDCSYKKTQNTLIKRAAPIINTTRHVDTNVTIEDD